MAGTRSEYIANWRVGLTDNSEVDPLQRLPVQLVLRGLADEAPEAALPDARLVALPRHEAHDVVAHRFLQHITVTGVGINSSTPS